MESQSELVGGEQNGQTVQPLVANQNDQNRDKKKQEIEDNKRELEKARKDNDDLKNKLASSDGKLAQALEDMDLIKGCVSLLKEEVTQHGALINMLQSLGNNSEQPTPYNADQFPGVN